jgi:Helix-turn-helix domain
VSGLASAEADNFSLSASTFHGETGNHYMKIDTQNHGSFRTAQLSFALPEILIAQLADALVARLDDADRSNTQSPWLDVAGAAAYLNSTSDAVRKSAQRGLLPGYQPYGPGSRWFFERSDLDSFIRGEQSSSASSREAV